MPRTYLQLAACWAATLDGVGHAVRAGGGAGAAREALAWHQKALALRPARAASLAATGLCLALLGREADAAAALHFALAKDPDDVVSLALLEAIVDRLDDALTGELPSEDILNLYLTGTDGDGCEPTFSID